MNEQELKEVAARLGSDAAARIDVDRMARQVVAKLRSEPAPVAWWRNTAVLRVAAVAVMLVTGGVVVNRLNSDRPVVELTALVGLEQLSAAELAEVLDSLDQMTPVYELVPASLDDLDETQLRDLLAAMEG